VLPWCLATLALAKSKDAKACQAEGNQHLRSVRLHSVEAGDAEAQIVVLVHGLDSWSGTWDSLMHLLAKRGIHTLAVDLRGHGESPMGNSSDFSPKQLAADVRTTLKALDLQGKRVALIGHSMGGRIALQYAADYPEDLNLLVIEDMDCVPRTYPVLTGEELKNCEAFSREFQSWDAARQKLISFGYDAERVDGWYTSSPPRVYERAGRMWSCINPFAQYLAKQTVLNSDQGQRSLQEIAVLSNSGRANFAVHVCVAGPGERGTVCSWDKLPGGIRDMQSILPSLQVHQFPAAGHSIHNTELENFAKLLETLLPS